MLFALASSCGGSAKDPQQPSPPEEKRYQKPITPELQTTIDGCRASGADAACADLCRQVFADENRPVLSCAYKVEGTELSVTGQYEKYADSSYSSGPDEPGCAGGRRPIGMVDCVGVGPSAVAVLLAELATMEAASVTSFVRIHHHLVELGAPRALRDRVAQAAADELAHTRSMVALARSYGASPQPPVIAAEPPMTLLARAIDNVVEGLVGETVAALHAALIATRAEDPEVRRVFAEITVDEAQHALLARELHQFFAPLLSSDEQLAVTAAYRLAVARALAAQPSIAMRELGVPAGPMLVDVVQRALTATAPEHRATAGYSMPSRA